MKQTFVFLSILAVCAATPAFANTKDHEAMMEKKVDYYLKQMDTDTDGLVSESEHEKFAENMFEEADTNDDDKLSRQEVIDHKHKEKEAMKQAGIIEYKEGKNKAKSANATDGKNDNRSESKQGESSNN